MSDAIERGAASAVAGRQWFKSKRSRNLLLYGFGAGLLVFMLLTVSSIMNTHPDSKPDDIGAKSLGQLVGGAADSADSSVQASANFGRGTSCRCGGPSPDQLRAVPRRRW
jgi:hypothetical protein